MLFFSAIFLFAFLPVLFVIYRVVPGIRAKNIVLLIFSLIFYCFGNIAHLPLLILSILVNWGAGRILGAIDKQKKPVRRAVVTTAAVLDLGLLAAYKYLDFFIGTLNALLGTAIEPVGLALPLGISFFTFTGLSYVIEVYRKPANMSRRFVDAALYIALFPNLLSGPILSWKTTAPQLENRTCTPEKTARGLRRFIVGMAKKLLIADVIGGIVETAFGSTVMDARLAWLGAVGYALQVYFDFSGYSDMALGLGGVFGFELPENFDHPYTALDLTDYWKRWHISLTTWFRNYLYMPMVMSKPLQRLYKRWAAKYGRPKANKLAILIPSTVVWLLTGLWHGPSWTYVLWGLWNGLFCVLEGVDILRTAKLKGSIGGRALLRVYTLLVVLLGAVFFRAENAAQAGQMIGAMFTGFRFVPEVTFLLQKCVTGLSACGLLAGIVGSTAIIPWLKGNTGKWGEPVSYVVCAALLVLCVMNIAVNGFQPFIYAQF
ncbi:MAG: MBOAT family O-acyltransferase [Oscillospiraceae bacterium]